MPKAQTTPAVPWHYRWAFTNWLMAKPWRWNLRTIYREFRNSSPEKYLHKAYYLPPMGRFRSAWRALIFPHVHHESEYAEADRFADAADAALPPGQAHS